MYVQTASVLEKTNSFLSEYRLLMHFAFFLVTEVFFLSYSQMGQNSSTLFMDIHRGMPT